MSTGPYNYSYIFKYIIIGDMGVGKSCLLHQFTEKKCKLKKIEIIESLYKQFRFKYACSFLFLFKIFLYLYHYNIK